MKCSRHDVVLLGLLCVGQNERLQLLKDVLLCVTYVSEVLQ